MKSSTAPTGAASSSPSISPTPHPTVRAPYVAPVLEPLGRWSALTLQQSVPIGPGGFLSDPEQNGRLA